MPGETVLLLETLECSPITATQIKTWTARDPVQLRVAERVLSGWSNTADETLISYQRRRDELSLEDGCVMWGNRVVVPKVGCQKVLGELHLGHPGMSRMKALPGEWCGGQESMQTSRIKFGRVWSVKSIRSFTPPVGMASPSLGASSHRLCRSIFGENVLCGG